MLPNISNMNFYTTIINETAYLLLYDYHVEDVSTFRDVSIFGGRTKVVWFCVFSDIYFSKGNKTKGNKTVI